MNELKLRNAVANLLLEQQGPSTRDRDDLLREFLQARFDCSDVQVNEDAKVLNLESLFAAANSTAAKSSSPNGKPDQKLFVISTQPRTRRLRRTWAVSVALATAAILLIYFAVSSQREQAPIVKDGPTPERPRQQQPPKSVPKQVVPRINSPKPEVIVERTPKKSLQPTIQKPEQVVANIVEFGSAGSVMGQPMVYAPGGAKPIVALPGMKLALGTRIETGDADKMEVIYENGTKLALDFNTVVEVPIDGSYATLPRAPKNILLKTGKIDAVVSKARVGEPFTISTPVAEAEVIGTSFDLALDKFGAKKQVRATLIVREGSVAFFNKRGRVVAASNTVSTALANSAPTEPRRLDYLYVPLERRKYKSFATHDVPIAVVETAPLSKTKSYDKLVFPVAHSGLTLTTYPAGVVRVVAVERNSPAAAAGIHPTDIVQSLDNRTVNDSQEVERLLATANRPRLRIARGESSFTVALLQVPKWPSVDLAPPIRQELQQSTARLFVQDQDASLTALQHLALRKPEAPIFNNIGVVLESQDKLGAAIRSYKRAVDLDEPSSLYRLNLSAALWQIGNYPRSLEELELAHELSKRSLQTTILLAEKYLLFGRFADVIDLTEQALTMFPKSEELWVIKARALFAQYRKVSAAEAADVALSISPDSVSANLIAGLVKGRAARAAAEQHLRKAVDLDPTSSQAFDALGNLLDLKKEWPEAERMYARSLELKPNDLLVLNRLGGLQIRMKSYDEAEQTMRRSLEINPEFGCTYHVLASMHIARKNEDDAIATLWRGVDAKAPCSENARTLSFLYSRRKPADLEGIKKVIAQFPNKVDTLELSIDYIVGPGLAKELETALRNAIRQYPNHSPYYNELGIVLVDTGRTEEAREVLEHAMSLDPTNVRLYWPLMNVYLAMKSEEKCDTLYKKWLTVEPENGTVFVNYGQYKFGRCEWKESEVAFRCAFRLAPGGYLNEYLAHVLLLKDGSVEEIRKLINDAVNNYERETLVAAYEGHDRAIRYFKWHASFYLAWAALNDGDAAQAETMLREMLVTSEFVKNDRFIVTPEHWLIYGQALEKNSKIDEAKSAYIKAKEMYAKSTWRSKQRDLVDSNVRAALERLGVKPN